MSVGYRNAPRDYYQHDNRRGAGGGPQRGGSRPGRYQNHRKPIGGRGYLKGNVSYLDADGDICMDEEPRDGGRFAPYAKPGYSQPRGGLRRGRGRGGPGGGDYGAGGSRGNHLNHGHLQQRFPDERSWNKILIPYGRRYEKNFIMKALTQACPIPFIPVNYHTDGNSAVFYLEDHEAAAALRQLNQKLPNPTGQKMSIVVRPSAAPLGTIPRESIEQVKSCMIRRHDHINRILDLSFFHTDAVSKQEGHFLPLYRQAVAFSVVEALEENYRDIVVLNLNGNKLKSLDVFGPCINKLKQLKALNLNDNMLKKSELERLKGLLIEDIWVRKNPISADFTLRADLVV